MAVACFSGAVAWAAEPIEDPAAAARRLGAKALSLLREATGDEDPEVRSLAIEAFGAIGNRAAVPLLQQALRDKDRSVQIVAAENLARLGDPAGISALERFASERPPKPKDAAPAAVEEVKALAKGKMRAQAIRALAKLGSAESEKVYRRGMKDPVGTVRDAAASALAKLGQTDELDPFLAAAQSEDEAVRLAAIRALGDAASPVALEPLLAAADDPSPQVRAAALEALAGLGGDEAVAPLRVALGDKNELVRAKAYEALGAFRAPVVAGSLEKAGRKEKNAYLQLLSLEALARHGREVSLDLAQRSLSQKDVDTRLVAVRVLDAAPGDQATLLLRAALADADARVRVQAARALVRRLGRARPPAAPKDAALVAPEDRVIEDPAEAFR